MTDLDVVCNDATHPGKSPVVARFGRDDAGQWSRIDTPVDWQPLDRQSVRCPLCPLCAQAKEDKLWPLLDRVVAVLPSDEMPLSMLVAVMAASGQR